MSGCMEYLNWTTVDADDIYPRLAEGDFQSNMYIYEKEPRLWVRHLIVIISHWIIATYTPSKRSPSQSSEPHRGHPTTSVGGSDSWPLLAYCDPVCRTPTAVSTQSQVKFLLIQ